MSIYRKVWPTVTCAPTSLPDGDDPSTNHKTRSVADKLLLVASLVVSGLLSPFADAQSPPRKLPACQTVGQTVTLRLNTGTAGPIPLPATPDPIWRIVLPTPMVPSTTQPVSAPALWLPNTSITSKWIQPASSGSPKNFPGSTYIYQTQFVTPVNPYLYTSITITGQFAADDSAVVRLNGISIAKCTPGSTIATSCYHSWQSIPAGVAWPTFNQLGGFLNTLRVEVKNTLPNSPSGLFVAAQVVAVCSKCTTPVPPPAIPCGGNPSTC
jgi:hypothetical protein